MLEETFRCSIQPAHHRSWLSLDRANKYVLIQKGLRHLFPAFTLMGLFPRDAISHYFQMKHEQADALYLSSWGFKYLQFLCELLKVIVTFQESLTLQSIFLWWIHLKKNVVCDFWGVIFHLYDAVR